MKCPIEAQNFKRELRSDDVYGNNQVMSLAMLAGMPVRKGLEQTIVCEGQVVNVVSSYT
jgi:hypothetical protein